MPKAKSVADVVAGEAVSGSTEDRWNDMVHIASVIANRAAMLGVTPEQVVSTTNQFNAYNKQMPPGTVALTDMAQQAMDFVAENGPVTDATFYATPAAVNNLPNRLSFETETTGHQYFSDPEFRGIRTSIGTITPNPDNLPSMISQDPLQAALTRPYEDNGLVNGVTALTAPYAAPTAVSSLSMPAVAADPAFGANGLLQGKPQTFAGMLSTPAQNNFGDLAAAGPISAPLDVSATGRMHASIQTPAFANVGLLGVEPSAENMAGLEAPAAAKVSLPTVDNFDVSRFGTAPFSVPGFDVSRFAPDRSMSAGMLAQRDFMGVDPKSDRLTGNVVQTADPGRMFTPDSAIASSDAALQAAISNALNAAPQDNFSQLAAAGPISAPMSIQQSGIIGAQPTQNSFSDLAAAGPMAAPVSVDATGILGSNPSLSANAAASMPAQTAENTGINSPLSRELQAQATKNLADMQAERAQAAMASATPTGILGAAPNLAAQASVPSGILSGYQQTPAVAPAVSAINAIAQPSSSLLSGQPIANAGMLTAPVNTSIMSIPSFPSSFVASDVAPDDSQSIGDIPGMNVQMPSVVSQNPIDIAKDPNVAMPSLDTATTPNQTTIAGPATTDATTQQTQQAVNNAVNQSQTGTTGVGKPGLFSGATKGTLAGGILGGVIGGPVGGILGALSGNRIGKNGGLTGLLSGAPMSINNIGTGLANTSSVWGGAPMGTQATANDGQSVTSLGNGNTAVTNKWGVTTVFGPNNTTAAYFGPSLFGTSHTTGTQGGGGGTGASL